jgi:hypothetical protein
MAGPELVVKFLGDVSGLEHASKKAEGATEKTTSKMSKLGMVAGGAAAVGIGIAAEALGKSVEAAEKDQVATERMESAFKAAHVALGPMKDSIEAATSSAGKLGFTQEQVKNSLGSLVIATHNGKTAVSDLSAAEDIARFKHIDLTAATKMLVMAQTGSQRATKQLGIEIQAVTVHQDKLKISYKASVDALKAGFPTLSKMTQAQKDQYDAKKNTLDLNYNLDKSEAKIQDHQITGARVIDEVTQKLHGQAAAYANTAAGAKERLGVALDDLEVKVGDKILPILTKLTIILADDLPKAMAYLSQFWAEHGDQIIAVTQVIKTVIGDAFEFFKAIVTTISDLIHGRWSKLWTDMEKVVKEELLLIKELITIQLKLVEEIFGGLAHTVKQHVDDMVSYFEKLPGRIGGTLANLAAKAIQPFKDAFTSARDTVRGAVDDVVSFFARLPVRIAATLSSLASKAVTPLVNAFHALGTAISDAIKAPINAVIRAIDSIAIPAFHIHIGMPSPVPDIDFGYGGSGPLLSIPTLDTGGFVAQTGIAVVHRGEEFLGVGAARRSAAGTVNHFHFPNYLGNERTLIDTVEKGLLQRATRNSRALYSPAT